MSIFYFKNSRRISKFIINRLERNHELQASTRLCLHFITRQCRSHRSVRFRHHPEACSEYPLTLANQDSIQTYGFDQIFRPRENQKKTTAKTFHQAKGSWTYSLSDDKDLEAPKACSLPNNLKQRGRFRRSWRSESSI